MADSWEDEEFDLPSAAPPTTVPVSWEDEVSFLVTTTHMSIMSPWGKAAFAPCKGMYRVFVYTQLQVVPGGLYILFCSVEYMSSSAELRVRTLFTSGVG